MKENKAFSITPAEIPPRKGKSSKYVASVEQFLASNEKAGKITPEGIKLNAVYSGFHRAIKNGYSDKVTLCRVDGELYIEKL